VYLFIESLAIRGKLHCGYLDICTTNMAFLTNIEAFLDPAIPDALVGSYCLLVAVELALKDANCIVPGSSHDIPSMLQMAASLPTTAATDAAQLNSFSVQLHNDLCSVTCQGKNGTPIPVPRKSYPHLRYGRRKGDWGGVAETSDLCLSNLETTCRALCMFLSTNGARLGVHL
jgi:hypothetical protein